MPRSVSTFLTSRRMAATRMPTKTNHSPHRPPATSRNQRRPEGRCCRRRGHHSVLCCHVSMCLRTFAGFT